MAKLRRDSQNLTGDTIIINSPYAVLAHHDKELQALLAEHEKTGASSIELDHLRILMDFVEQRVRPKYVAASKKLQQKNPTVTFDDVWYMQRPGQMAYAKHDGVWLGCQIESIVHLDSGLDSDDEWQPERWRVFVWFLNYDWRGSELGTTEAHFDVDKFDGESAVTDLVVYPRHYFDNEDAGERRAHFGKRGMTMRDILWKGHQYMYHDGIRADATRSRVCISFLLLICSTKRVNADKLHDRSRNRLS